MWQRFRRHRVALVGAIILLLLAMGSLGAPVLAANDPYRVDISAYRQGPQAKYPLGTDSSGRDVLSRLLHAGRVSLSVGLVAVTIYTRDRRDPRLVLGVLRRAGGQRSSCASPTSSSRSPR